MIKITGLSKKIGNNHILKNIDLTFPSQGLVALLGPSGSGKTTLLNCLSLLTTFEGKIEIDGTLVSSYKEKDKSNYRLNNYGFIFQDYKLYENDTVLNNILFPLEINSGMKQTLKIRKALDVLTIVNLKDKKGMIIKNLSGGEKQRVAIARALINNPKIVLADEPTGSLDNKNSEEIMSLLSKISKQSLVIMVSHDKYSCKKYANEIIHMKDGNIVNHQYNNAINNIDNHIMINLGKNIIKKPKIPFNFLFRHTLSCLKERKWRTIICNAVTSLGLIGIGLSFSISDTLSSVIKNVYSSIIEENKIMVEPTDEMPSSTNIYFASYNQAAELGHKYKDLIDDIGIYYYADYQHYFDFEGLYMQKNQKQISGISFSDINEFMWLDDYPTIKCYPSRPKTLLDDEVILSLTIDMIQSVCYSLQIARTVSSLSNYMTSNEFFVYFRFRNNTWKYEDEQILKVRGFVLNTISGFYHYNHHWNEVMYEDNMRLTTIDNFNKLKNPWDLRKIYYLKSSNVETLLIKSRMNDDFSYYSLELASSLYYAKLYKNTSPNEVDRVFLLINKTDRIHPSLISYFNNTTNNISSPIFGSSGGYAIFPEYLMMGFSKTTYFSFDEVLLDDAIDSNSFIDLNDGESITLPTGLCEGHFTKSLNDGVTFSSLEDRELTKYKVKSTSEIVISSALEKELKKSNNNNSSVLYISFATEERELTNGKTMRNFVTREIKVNGVIESEKKIIYHSSYWPLIFFQFQMGISVFDLGVETICFTLKNSNQSEKTIAQLNKAFPSYKIFNPLSNLNSGIEETCFYIQIALVAFSLVATLISIVLLYLTNYLFLIERKVDIGIARCIGASKNESKKFLYSYSFISGAISFILSTVELIISSLVISYSLSNIFDVGMSFTFNIVAVLMMLVLSFLISFLSSFFLSKKFKKYDVFDLLND